MENIRTNLANRGLVRPTDGRILGGVCAGIGQRFGLDPWPTRFLFILTLLLIPGSQILIYPLLWVLMPAEGQVQTTSYQPNANPPAAV